ncbi:MAG: polymerase sigma-70 factor, subfamily [Bryobacterales bacterium]|jgi:RNA polymerase sigma-70 factor (ECF subfamily)|nr:polymerase sigma-70 factor, subfamily [Bryobacterales bacterium]
MTDEAFRSLYGQYRVPLFRFAYRLTGSAPVAEDIVHDCFVGLFRGGYKAERASQRTYLYAAIRNLSRKHHRDSGREDELCDVVDQVQDPLGTVVSQETSEEVRRAVEALPLLQREVLVLFEYEELPLDEIAKIVDAELAAVKSRLHRARERLRKALIPAMKGMTK